MLPTASPMAPTPAAQLGQSPGLGGGMGIEQLLAMLGQGGGGMGGMPPPGPPGMGPPGMSPPGMMPPGMDPMAMMQGMQGMGGEQQQGESMLQQILTMLMMGQPMQQSFKQNLPNAFGQGPEMQMPMMPGGGGY